MNQENSNSKSKSQFTAQCCGLLPAYSFYGAPGSGKGTQGMMVAERKSFLHLSAGDILRHKIAEEDPVALTVKEQMISGALIDDSLIQQLVHDELKQKMHDQNIKGVVLDGFPRNLNQAKTVVNMLESLHVCFVGMLNLDVPEDEIFQRLMHRAVIEKRVDDNEQSIRKRMEQWHLNYTDLRTFFSEYFKFYPINGVGSTEEVYERILHAIGCTCRKLSAIHSS